MIRIPHLILPTLLLALTASAQGRINPATADIHFDKVRHDAGKIMGTRKVVHMFKFRNRSKQQWRITHMAKTCLCAQAWLVIGGKEYAYNQVVLSPQPLPPGAEGQVKMVLDFNKGKTGHQDGTATLRFTNAKNQHRHTKLVLEATGVPYFTVTPNRISFDKLTWNSRQDFAFTVTSKHLKGWHLLDWKQGVPQDVALEEPIRTEKDGLVTYSFKGHLGPTLKPGSVGGTLVFKTDTRNEQVRVDVTGQVADPITISRSHLGFGVVPRRRGASTSFTIKNNETERVLRILETKVVRKNRLSRFFKVDFAETVPGREIKVTLTLLRDLPRGHVRGEILLKLNHPFIKEKRVSFGGIVR